MTRYSLALCMVLSLVFAVVFLRPIAAAPQESNGSNTISVPPIDGDTMLLNQNVILFACIVDTPFTQFDADEFIEKALGILTQLPKGEFNRTSQFELLEYCSWDTRVADEKSFCGAEDEGPTYAAQTLVRFGVAGVDGESLKRLSFSSLSAILPPFIQGEDPALFPPDKRQHFVERMMNSDNTFDVVAVVVLFLYPILLFYYLLTSCTRERIRDKQCVEFLRNSINSELAYRQHMKCAEMYASSGQTVQKCGSDAYNVELEDMDPHNRVNVMSREGMASGEVACNDGRDGGMQKPTQL
ncbi:hypothetical protein Tb927.7.470 [Trypanosoma brucei brucei TREU927]|uniref:T. brucei spp.-specific protein n=1 Tax=Trypanosoma brucei brucei (strain 927/4 GUTat10.1) TaxID=185431 RepID=Q57U07_TRYB2|nr:hypothetical protein Tb927.7.470 [Trypanosoma brucei brucei TREU927]AAX70911.1 hypothetical protein Tb927.7.470 [Trypanosoma brucei]AAZ12112.1 hypothetical protein Tb927.7.470 [Trypanosoma brucei brucei TREU927]